MKKNNLLDLDLQLFADDKREENNQEEKKEAEDKKEQKENKEEPEKKYTDEDVNKIIDKKFVKWKLEQEKAQKEAEKLANMTDKEKEDHELKKLQEKLKEYEEKEEFQKMAKQVGKMLTEKKVTISENLINLLVKEDAESTKEVVDEFIEEFNNSVDEAVKKALAGKTPGVTVTGGTKEKANPYASQRNAMDKVNNDIKSNWN